MRLTALACANLSFIYLFCTSACPQAINLNNNYFCNRWSTRPLDGGPISYEQWSSRPVTGDTHRIQRHEEEVWASAGEAGEHFDLAVSCLDYGN